MKNKVEKFRSLLYFRRDRHLVGVKFIRTKEEYDACPVKEATHQMFYCMMVKSATVGHALKAKHEHMYCGAASAALGFEPMDPEVISGKVYCERCFCGTPEIGAEVGAEVPFLTKEVYGLVVQPLELFGDENGYQEEPDLVIMVSDPYNAMRIMQAYTYRFGNAEHLHFVGMGGVCTELTARAMKYQDLSITLFCSGTRFAAEWRDEEMGIAIPYSMFDPLLAAVHETANTYEPDDKKMDIIERAEKVGLDLGITLDTNYHESSIGVVKMGVEGYPKKITHRKARVE